MASPADKNLIAMFPLVAYGLLMLGTRPLISALRAVAIVALMAVAILLASRPLWVTPREFNGNCIISIGGGRPFKIFADWYAILSMVVDFIFRVCGGLPLQNCSPNLLKYDIRGYFESVTRFAGFALWIGVFGYALVATFGRRNRESLMRRRPARLRFSP